MRARGEGGFAVTMWALTCSLLIMVLVLLAVDAWKIVTVDRRLAAAVDSAAAAGANGVDEAEWRRSGTLALSPPEAEALAAETLYDQPGAGSYTDVQIAATPERVTVEARSTVRLLLLAVVGETGRTVYAAAEATPRRSP